MGRATCLNFYHATANEIRIHGRIFWFSQVSSPLPSPILTLPLLLALPLLVDIDNNCWIRLFEPDIIAYKILSFNYYRLIAHQIFYAHRNSPYYLSKYYACSLLPYHYTVKESTRKTSFWSISWIGPPHGDLCIK